MSSTSETAPTRRDFIYVATGAFAALGAAHVAWPFIQQMTPSAAVRALATIEVDVSSVTVGQQIKVLWQGKPIFIRRRTAAEIEEAVADDAASMKDPQPDAERHKDGKAEWLVMVGVCTHLGCVPLGEAGDFNGWFCPCHGSHYDTSGRIRKGPAPLNLPIPPYEFVSDTKISIG